MSASLATRNPADASTCASRTPKAQAARLRRLDARIVRRAMAAMAIHAEGDAHATAAAQALTEAERQRLEALVDATCPRFDHALQQMAIACRLRAVIQRDGGAA
ncbi:hypothetical protein [Pseudorhodoferax sp. Leaf274]|uniref:hypothetical protein n=1 Tax=Pseudorhodoferax sp. Leaf274 TaxID=1736318 RepID=UPI0007036C21|nr:hypothetical protein [Pseudorhodoferax sp. Leaf274]KQP37572.1 hypothetical protein ASF44_14615 [Pseudorhodoferax sp. Leaf274]